MTKCVIAANPRCSRPDGKVIFLANRNVCDEWWTLDLSKAMVYNDPQKARARMKSLKYNNPRVMKLGAAHALVESYGKEK